MNIRRMLSRTLYNWLGWIAATVIAVCSCTNNVQELAVYWNGHDFTSLDGFNDIDEAEDKFDGYIDLLSKVPYELAMENLSSFLDSAARNTVAYMVWTGWFEPYFHAPQSPYKNDEMFAFWLDKVLKDNVIDDGAMVEHLQVMRAVIDKNKVGSTLVDVSVRDSNGQEYMLTEFLEKKSMILLVDANCPSCMKSLEENVNVYKDANRIAVLVGGGDFHLQNIRRQVPEDILEKWTLVCVPQRRLEDALYDTSIMPIRLLVSSKGEIIKSYH